MSIAIEHPDHRRPAEHRQIPVLPVLLTIVVAALVVVVAIQWSGVFSSDGQPSAPAAPASRAQGPNVGLAPDWAGDQAATRSIAGPNVGLPALDVMPDSATATANAGPNEGLAPDLISQHAAFVAADLGPNVGLPTLDVMPQSSTANQGPNTGLAPTWADG